MAKLPFPECRLSPLVGLLPREKDLDFKLEDGSGCSEMETLVKSLRTFVTSIKPSHEQILALKQHELMGHLATQVAHDMRSPLAALGALKQNLSGLDCEQMELLEAVIARIEEIGSDLLSRGKSTSSLARTAEKPLSQLIREIVAEKELQLSLQPARDIQIHFMSETNEILPSVGPAELKRVMSNLLNNSLEALGNSGQVHVSVKRSQEGHVEVQVRDSGAGIPIETLARLGKRGASFGKTDGLGLGLYHAKTTVEAWGGTLALHSEVGIGTAVILQLPNS